MMKRHYSKLRKSSFSFSRRYSTDAVIFSAFEPYHGSSEDLYTKKTNSILPRSSGQLLKTFGCQRSLTTKGVSFEKKAHRSKSLTQIDCLETSPGQRLMKGADANQHGDQHTSSSGLRSTSGTSGSTLTVSSSNVSASTVVSTTNSHHPNNNNNNNSVNSKFDSSPESSGILLSDIHYPSDRLVVPNYHHPSSLTADEHDDHPHSTTLPTSSTTTGTTTSSTSSSSLLRFNKQQQPHHEHHQSHGHHLHHHHSASMLSHNDTLILNLDHQYANRDFRALVDDGIRSNQVTGTRKGYAEESGPGLVSHDGTLKGTKTGRGQLARRSGGIFSNPFKTDREKMDQLTELLNQYSIHGIPEQTGLLSFKLDSEPEDVDSRFRDNSTLSSSGTGNPSATTITSAHYNNHNLSNANNVNSYSSNNNSNPSQSVNVSPSHHPHHQHTKQLSSSYEESLYLEDHWRCIVTSWESMPKKLQNQQDAIWELLHTEVFYIKRLKVISDLFLACLCNLQSECLLNDIDTEKMFSNITEVYSSNHHFWMNHLLPMLKASRESHQPLNPIIMREGFLKFEDIFHPYVKYCLEHSNCLQYVKEKHKESELFKAYVVWCETRKDCDRLRLMDLLVKPMQRLTKYSLLLKAILKKSETEEQKIALKQMNDSVERFVCRVDACLRRRHDQERLSSIVSRIESYDALDSSNDEVEKVLKEFTRLNLTCPMPGCLNHRIRQLLLEGSGLKLRDSYTSSKLDVHCFLFTDTLLICKSVSRKGDRVRVIRQPFLVDRIVTHELKDGSGFIVIYLNEFNVASAFFTLYTTETRTWLEHIKRAQDHYREAKQQSALYTANQSSLLYRTVDGDDEDSDFPSTALLVTNTSPRSSRSSLMRSQSGSMDISDSTLALGSSSMIVPSTTPNLLSQNYGPDGEPLPSRAISFELGELRNPSMTFDDLEPFGRSHSMETRPPPISVTITSPRPERRAFLLRGAGSERSYDSMYGSNNNTLSVNVPSLHVNNKHFTGLSRTSETSIQVPVLSKQAHLQQHLHHQQQQQHYQSGKPTASPPSSSSSSSSNAPRQRSVSPRSLQRSLPISSGYPAANKPPLVKMKNITGLKVHSAPPSEGPSPVHSFDSEAGTGEGCPSSASCALTFAGVDTVDTGFGATTVINHPVGYNTSVISIGESSNSDIYPTHLQHHHLHHLPHTESPSTPGITTTMTVNDSIGEDDLDTAKSRLHQKRSVRGERRYHTADSIENIKKEKDSSIHKRLSWNFGQQTSSGPSCCRGVHCQGPGPGGSSLGHERVLCNKHFNKCLSSESVYTSSGFSSTGSVPLSVNSCECDQCGIEVLGHIQEIEPSLESSSSPIHSPYPTSRHHYPHPSVTINERGDEETSEEMKGEVEITEVCSSPRKIIITESDADGEPGDPEKASESSSKSSNPVIAPSDIKIDVSEVKDGISSVQITLSGTNIGKPSKSDLKKMKEFLLTSLEASEV